MLQIGFGLFLYKVLCILAWVFGAVVVLPFLMNCFDGKGYGYNFKRVWSGFCWIVRLGTAKRS